jgi:DNA-directed RNA polymerase specialized sigma24 family protein
MSDPQPRDAREHHTRHDAIATYYNAHAAWLEQIVARRAKVPHATIEEACQTAWLTLIRRTDITLDNRGLRWLTVVATHEAWRLAKIPERPVGPFIASTGDDPLEWQEPPGPASDPLELAITHEEHEHRLEHFADAKPREATLLFLQAAGYSYTELAKLTDSTYRTIDRRITKGRKRIGASRRDNRRKKPRTD